MCKFIYFCFKMCCLSFKLQYNNLSIYISQWQYINMIMIIINSINLIKKGMKKWQYKPVKTVLQYSKNNNRQFNLLSNQLIIDFHIAVKNTLFSSHNTSCWQNFKTFYTTIISLSLLYINVAELNLAQYSIADTSLFFKSCCFQKDNFLSAIANQKPYILFHTALSLGKPHQ